MCRFAVTTGSAPTSTLGEGGGGGGGRNNSVVSG